MKRLGLAAGLLLCGSPLAAQWVPAWTAAPFPATPVLTPKDVRDYAAAEVRQESVVNTGGDRVRVVMTNALGKAPLTFLAASISVRGTTKPLTFAGRPGRTIPSGGSLISDPLPLKLHPFETVAVSVRYGAGAVPAAHLLPVTVHYADGRVASGRGPALAASVQVDRAEPSRLIVAFGDSITEGFAASAGAYTGWPERLARRLAADPAMRRYVVVNAGISGNRLLRDGAGPNALARLDRDVLAVPGATDLILLEGINDIGWGNAKPATDGPVTAADVIAAYRQIIARAHGRSLRVIGGTITPFRGSIYFTPTGEAVRQTVNRWIRTAGAFDAVVDFEAAVADPRDPTRLDPAKDPGDHLHPNDNGYAAMAAAVKANLLTGDAKP